MEALGVNWSSETGLLEQSIVPAPAYYLNHGSEMKAKLFVVAMSANGLGFSLAKKIMQAP